jgi:hypothetical protein
VTTHSLPARAAILILPVLLLAGCSSGQKRKPVVIQGSVTLQGGEPVRGVSLIFDPVVKERPNLVYPAFIRNNGKYNISDVPTGSYKVYLQAAGSGVPTDVNPHELAAKLRKEGKENALGSLAGAKLPERYFKPDTSGWAAEIAEGEQTHNFEVRPTP